MNRGNAKTLSFSIEDMQQKEICCLRKTIRFINAILDIALWTRRIKPI